MRVLHVDPDISDTATFRHFPCCSIISRNSSCCHNALSTSSGGGQYPNRWWSLDLFHQLEPDGDDTGGDTVASENL